MRFERSQTTEQQYVARNMHAVAITSLPCRLIRATLAESRSKGMVIEEVMSDSRTTVGTESVAGHLREAPRVAPIATGTTTPNAGVSLQAIQTIAAQQIAMIPLPARRETEAPAGTMTGTAPGQRQRRTLPAAKTGPPETPHLVEHSPTGTPTRAARETIMLGTEGTEGSHKTGAETMRTAEARIIGPHSDLTTVGIAATAAVTAQQRRKCSSNSRRQPLHRQWQRRQR